MTPPPRRARVAGPLAVAALALLVGGASSIAGCKKTPSIGFSLHVPSDAAPNVAWYEIGIFNGPACASLGSQLGGGVPPAGYVKRLAFRGDDRSPPGLGDLPRAKYAIAVAARASDCSVIATGCNDVDFTSASSVDVSLNDTSPAQGACSAGSVCDQGRCTPGTDNSNPNVGAGCSLVLLGAGPFADPLLGSGSVTSAPSIAPTASGFLVAYREYDPFAGAARLTVVPIDNGGGSLGAQQSSQSACVGSQESDATGLVFHGTSGVIALARAPCASVGGIDLFGVGGDGVVTSAGFDPHGGAVVDLSTSHALASSAAGTFLAYTEDNAAKVAFINGLGVGSSYPFGGDRPMSDAWVATTDKLVALLAAGTSTTTAVPDAGRPVADAGDDGGEGGLGAADVVASPPTLEGATLRLNVVAAGAPLGTLDPPVLFPGSWASIAAQSGRVFVASAGDVPDKPVVYRAFDLGTANPSISDGFTTQGLGRVLFADVAYHQDHVFFAVERAGAISLVAFDHASTSPTTIREVALGSDPRIPSLSSVRDGRLAVAATDTRVILAWTTGATLTSNDAVGGYAVFACTTP